MFGQNTFQVREAVTEEEVNLTPMMNLFVVLIPFLLMNAAFIKLSIINASVPTIADAPLKPGQSEKVLNVSLRVESDGFHISGSGDNLTAQELDSVRTSIRKRSGEFDYDRLNITLQSIKERFPRGKTVMMFPDKSINYQTLVNVMDTARWSKSKETSDRKLLYNEVVLTSTVGVE